MPVSEPRNKNLLNYGFQVARAIYARKLYTDNDDTLTVIHTENKPIQIVSGSITLGSTLTNKNVLIYEGTLTTQNIQVGTFSDNNMTISGGSITNTRYFSSDIGSFTTLYGDGSNLTGVSASGSSGSGVIKLSVNKNITYTHDGTNYGDQTANSTKVITQLNASLTTGTYYVFGTWETDFVNNPLSNQKLELKYYETDPSLNSYTDSVSSGTLSKTFYSFQGNNNSNNISFVLNVPADTTYYLAWVRSSDYIYNWGSDSSNLTREKFDISYINDSSSAMTTYNASFTESNSSTRYGDYLTTNSPSYYTIKDLNFTLTSGTHFVFIDWFTEYVDSPLGEQFLELHYKTSSYEPTSYTDTTLNTTLYQKMSIFKSNKNNNVYSLIITVPPAETHYFSFKRYSNAYYLWGTTSTKLKNENITVTVSRVGNTSNPNYVSYGGTSVRANTNETISLLTNSDERLKIDSSGNVGIGTDTPTSLLHVDGEITSSSLTDGTLKIHSGNIVNALAGSFTNLNSTTTLAVGPNANTLFSMYGYLGTSEDYSKSMFILNNSNAGGYYWRIYHNNHYPGGDRNLYFRHLSDSGEVSRGYISKDNNNVLNFTGQHRTFIKDYSLNELQELEGLIVCANKNNYTLMSGSLTSGLNAITTNEALPDISLCIKDKDKSCFGVLSNIEDSNQRVDMYGSFCTPFKKEEGDTRPFVNAVGEGGIWVSNKNGVLESGDYITTSSIPGYGMKQDEIFLANFTVAKITMDCNFIQSQVPKKKILTEPQEITETRETTSVDINGNIITNTITETITKQVNVLDSNGFVQFVDTNENENKYRLRYLLPNGTQITESEYNTKIANNETVYLAAFVGCTYHCG